MNRNDIVTKLVQDSVVEKMVGKITRKPLNEDMRDLVQMVYLILLEYDENKLCDLWTNNQMSYFLARIIINQFRSYNSPFHTLFRKYQSKATDISGMDWIDESQGNY